MKRVNVKTYPIIGEEPRGTNEKFWIKTENGNKLVKFNSQIYPDMDIMEAISAQILNELGIDCVEVELGKNMDQKCCIVKSFLEDEADILQEIDQPFRKRNITDLNRDILMCFGQVFGIFYKLNIPEEECQALNRSYIRKTFGDCLIGNEDGKLKNTGLIFNERNLKYRLTPSFDNGLAFHAYIYNSLQSVCHIGNQEFYTEDILKYIISNNYDDVSDIIEKFVQMDYYKIIQPYQHELEKEKQEYIIDYLNNIKLIINNLICEKPKVKTLNDRAFHN